MPLCKQWKQYMSLSEFNHIIGQCYSISDFI